MSNGENKVRAAFESVEGNTSVMNLANALGKVGTSLSHLNHTQTSTMVKSRTGVTLNHQETSVFKAKVNAAKRRG